MRALSIGATGALAQQLNVDVIANNIANLETTAFKRSRVEFQDLLYQSIRRVGSASSDTGTVVPAGVQVGLGVQAAATYRIQEQGTLEVTDNPLDLALDGNGFFQVQLPDGEIAYTRAGAFQLNEDGEIVTPDGFLVQGPGAIPQGAIEISINAEGVVEAALDGQVDPVNVGQFDITTFPNPVGLEAIGSNLFLETPASGAPIDGQAGDDGFAIVRQGFLENSNVNVVQELTNLISAQRAYEMNSNVIETTDEILQRAGQLS